MLAIGSIACKKNEATDPGTFTIEDSISSDTLVRSPLNSDKGYNKVPINISFSEKSGNGFSYSLAATYTNASITVDTDIFYNNGEITFSDDIYNTLTSDGYRNATLTFTLTADNAGLNNPTIVKSYDIKLIKATVITNEDTTANGLNLSNAINISGELYNETDEPNFKFGASESTFNNSQITFTSTANNSSATNMSADIISAITDNIKKGANFSKYFSDLAINFDSNATDNKSAYYKARFSLHLTNDMTNANGYTIQFKGNGGKELTDVRGNN